MLIFLLAILFWQASLLFATIFGAPTVYANSKAIIDAYNLAELKGGETVLDLGCGNARSLIIAAKKFGAKGIGVEISPYCYLKSKWNVFWAGEKNNINIYYSDLRRSRELIKKADVIYLYLINSVLKNIENDIFSTINKRAKIVVLSFEFPNVKASKIVSTKNLGKDTTLRLYLGDLL